MLPSHIGVLGLGNWGTALANHLASKGIAVTGWCLEPEIATEINRSHRNPRYLSHVALEPGVRATNTLADVMGLPMVVFSVPSAYLTSLAPLLRMPSRTLLVSATKGLDHVSCQTPLQYLSSVISLDQPPAVISGPSFARDVVVRRPCGIVAASSSAEVAKIVAETFCADSMKVYTSGDPLGVEIGGIVKNVIALAAGVSDGLGFGDSARAGLITRGLAEMMRLGQAMGADVQTFSGLSGLGDLVMTASCDQSRNRTVGVRLGKGERLPDILANLGSVAEGVETTPLVVRLAQRYQVTMPITFQVDRLLRGEGTPLAMAQELMTRPMRSEF